MSSKPQPFDPYANEADVLHIGLLMIENRLDRVTISGDLDLTADQTGLAKARELQAVIAAVIARLEERELPFRVPTPAHKTIDNPF